MFLTSFQPVVFPSEFLTSIGVSQGVFNWHWYLLRNSARFIGFDKLSVVSNNDSTGSEFSDDVLVVTGTILTGQLVLLLFGRCRYILVGSNVFLASFAMFSIGFRLVW